MIDLNDLPDFDGAPVAVLRELLSHGHAGVRADAACALGDRLRTRELSALDPQDQEALVARLVDEAPMVCFEAAIALAEVKDPRATEILLQGMRLRRFRLDAIRALGTGGDPRAIPALHQLMKRWLMPWADKLQAAAALCALGDAVGSDYLQEKISSRRAAERAAAIHFVGESRHPQALQYLGSILQNPQDDMLDVAVRALGTLGDQRAIKILNDVRLNACDDLLTDIDEVLLKLAAQTKQPVTG